MSKSIAINTLKEGLNIGLGFFLPGIGGLIFIARRIKNSIDWLILRSINQRFTEKNMKEYGKI